MKILHTTKAITLLVLLLFVASCKRGSTKILDGKNAKELSEYITAYTSGVISRAEPILIKLTTPQEVEAGSIADGSIFSISPSVKGELIWKDNKTLAFMPAELLPPGKKFTGTFKLHKLYNHVPKDLSSLSIEFSTIPMQAYLTMKPPTLEEQSKTFSVEGSISASDVLEEEEVVKVLTVKGVKDPAIQWKHAGDTYSFVIKNIPRKTKEQDVHVSWKGKNLHLENLESTVNIPASGKLKVLQIKSDEASSKPSFKVYFSELIDKKQNFNGVVSIKGYTNNITYTVTGSVLSVFPNKELMGNYKVEVSKGLKSLGGLKLAQPYTQMLEFAKRGPQLRLAGRGVIAPRSGTHVFFPFEAVALKYVNVEVFKIFNNNVLQFLQVNEPDGNQDLNRVGRIIYQKRIALRSINPNANASIWTRYALDLSAIVDQDPSAIYQVRIAFQPGCASGMECEDFLDIETINFLPVEQRDDVKSIMGNYYGYDGYFSGYEWSNQDNPCKKEYYRKERFIQRNVILSDMGIIAKTGDKKEMFLSITDLNTTKPMGRVELEFFDYQQQSILSGKTDADGVFHSVLSKVPYFVKATKGDKVGYLRMAAGQNLSISRFDVDGQVIQEGTKGFLYGDRGVWRPGDSIFLNFILVKEEGMEGDYPVTLTLNDARNNVYLEKTVSKNLKGLYSFAVATRPDAPTGYWNASINAGGSSFHKTLRIETVKPNRLKMITDLPEKLTANNVNKKVNLQVNWLHGAPASYVDVQVKRQFKRMKTTFNNYGDFKFDDPTMASNYQVVDVFQGKTDEAGSATFADEVVMEAGFPGMMKIGYQVKATEKGGDFSTDNFSIEFSPYKAYAGLMIPKESGYKKFNVREPNTVKIISLTDEGKPIAGRKLELNLYKLRWSWWWDSDDDFVSRFNKSRYASPVETVKVITDSKGQATWEITPPNYGRYLVRVYDPENGQSSGDIAYAGYPWGDNNSREQLQAAAMLPLEPEKKTYNVGDKVSVKVPTGKVGRALITIEKGGTILSTFKRESKEGTNVFTFTATEQMVPNVYVSVSMIQPHADTGNDLPMRMYGIVSIKIEDPKGKLQPKIATAKKWEPDSDVTIEVSEAEGRSMAYTIAIVDDGLLDLTRFKTPSPYGAFNAKEALGIRTWDVYDYILGSFNGDNNRILAIGGDDESKVDKEKSNNANRFKPVVIHLGPFELKKGRKAKHKFHFPNYVGSVRAMVVAVGDKAYGKTDQTIPVKKPLMVQPTLPRVLGSGESLMLPVTVFAMEPDVTYADITLSETSGLVTFPEGKTKRVKFAKLGDQVVYFPVNVKDVQGVAKFKIKATSGKHVALDEIEIAIRNANPMMSEVVDFVIRKGETMDEKVIPFGVGGSNTTSVELASVPPLNLGKRLDYVIQYPHGCIEQTTSSVFPQLYVDALMDLNAAKQEEVTRNIKAGIERLKLFQVGDGGFAYWPGNSNSDAWGSNYAGHFLVEAKAKGYVVPTGMFNNWLGFQRNLANSWRTSTASYNFSAIDQAYRLMTLALAGKPLNSAMNRLRKEAKLPNMARWHLAAAYALIGKKDIGKQILAEATYDIKDYRELAYSYGSSLRDKSVVLQTMQLLDMKTKSFVLLKDISKSLSSHSWYSTHSTAYGLLAISNYYTEHKPSQLKYGYTINGQSGKMKSDKPLASHEIKNADMTQSIAIKNTTDGDLFVRILRKGKPKAGTEKSISDIDLKMNVVYKNLNGERINPQKLPRGKDFYAEVQIVNPGTKFRTYENMALTQIFPSGWEIGNSRMSEVEVFSNDSDFDYQDIRDDRVFTYFSVNTYKSVTYRVLLNAAYPGKYYLPATYCEAMYDNDIRAATKGKWVEVVN